MKMYNSYFPDLLCTTDSSRNNGHQAFVIPIKREILVYFNCSVCNIVNKIMKVHVDRCFFNNCTDIIIVEREN